MRESFLQSNADTKMNVWRQKCFFKFPFKVLKEIFDIVSLSLKKPWHHVNLHCYISMPPCSTLTCDHWVFTCLAQRVLVISWQPADPHLLLFQNIIWAAAPLPKFLQVPSSKSFSFISEQVLIICSLAKTFFRFYHLHCPNIGIIESLLDQLP